MRIIDKNTDFYDYLQGTFPDQDNVFDRTKSFMLSKEMLGSCLARTEERLLLLRVGATNWLFLIDAHPSDKDYFSCPAIVDFDAELITTWKNYDRPLKLVEMSLITPSFGLRQHLVDSSRYLDCLSFYLECKYDINRVKERIPDLQIAINKDDFRTKFNIISTAVYLSHNAGKEIPILRGSGLAQLLDATDVFLAFDEYFSLQKQAQERTASIGITDKEKVINHGFDAKTSFRGKNKPKRENK